MLFKSIFCGRCWQFSFSPVSPPYSSLNINPFLTIINNILTHLTHQGWKYKPVLGTISGNLPVGPVRIWPPPVLLTGAILTLYQFFLPHLFAWCTIRTKNQLKWPRNLLLFISDVTRRIAFPALFSQLVRIQSSLITIVISARSPLS